MVKVPPKKVLKRITLDFHVYPIKSIYTFPFFLVPRFFYTHSGRGLGPVARAQVLRRTLGDILCGVSQLPSLQKWVTLQPNSDFNEVEDCNAKERLDMRAIAQEIAKELDEGGRLVSPSSSSNRNRSSSSSSSSSSSRGSGRRLVNGGPRNRNNLLRKSVPQTSNRYCNTFPPHF